MSFAPNVEEQELLAENYRRAGARMNARDWASEALMTIGFGVAVAAVWAISPPTTFHAVPAVLCMAVLALAMMVKFDTPFGFTVPAQLGFVPLVFALPPALVPIAVVLALVIPCGRDVLTGKSKPTKLLFIPGNAWFAVGPALVFAIANVQASQAGPVLLLIALVAQFAVDFVVSSVRYAIARHASIASQVGEAWVYLVDAALAGVALLAARNVTTTPAVVLALVPLLWVLATFAKERRHRLENALELGNAYRGTALVLGDVVEAEDGYTAEHCKNVVALSLAVAEQLDLTADQRRNLEFGALLHDIGKIAIPKDILNKPGRLDPDEWTIIQTHTIEGQKMLDQVGGFMREVGLIVRAHHERWDGGGYPDRLAGEAIPFEARIVACCDTWNAMRTDRVYRQALPYETALGELRSVRGSQLDPRVVDALIAILESPGSEQLRADVEITDAGELARAGRELAAQYSRDAHR
jgi:putative nucleotidyltransferase with HDIG domain